MPAQVATNLLVTELGEVFIKAHEQVKNVEVKPGNTLPDGLKGIAQLREIGIRKISKGSNVGKLMFYADAIIQEPESQDGMKVAGKRTFVSEPIYDTPTRTRKTVQEHIQHIYMWAKMLGVKLEKITAVQVEVAMRALINPQKPVFIAFRTWQPPKATSGQYANKQSMMMHFWDEKIEYKKKNVAADSVNVNLAPLVEDPEEEVSNEASSETETNNGTVESGIPETSINTEKTNGIETSTETGTEVNLNDLDRSDIASHVKRATEDSDLVSVTILTEMGLKAGFTQQQINECDSWAKLVDDIKAKELGTKKEEEVALKVGDSCRYCPIDPNTKKKALSPVDVEITAISDSGTVDLKNLANKKIAYKNIPVDELLPTE